MANMYDDLDEQHAPSAPQPKQKNMFDDLDAAHFHAIDPSVLTPAQRHHYTLWQAAKAAVANSVNSAKDFGHAVATTYQHPIDTADALLQAGAGLPAAMANTDANAVKFGKAIVHFPAAAAHYVNDNYVGNSLADTYDKIKTRVAEHPIQSSTDLATLFSGGAGALESAAAHSIPGAVATFAAKKAASAALTAGAEGLTNHLISRGIPGAVAKGVVYGPPLAASVALNPLNALKPLGKGVSAATRYGVDALTPQRVMVLGASNGLESELLNNLDHATSHQIVPGSTPTLGPALGANPAAGLGPVLSTKTAALADTAQGMMSDEAKAIEARNNVARITHMKAGRNSAENTAAFGTPVMNPDDAEAIKDAQAKSGYARANGIVSKLDSPMMQILDGPFSKMAIDNATKTVNQSGKDLFIGSYSPAVPAHTVPSGILDASGKPIMITVPAKPEVFPSISGQHAQILKEEFDALLYGRGDAGAVNLTPAQKTALLSDRNKLVKWISDNNDPWRQTRERYALQSGIIDRMRTGDVLEGKLTRLPGDDTGEFRTSNFANALDQPGVAVNPTIRKSTGVPRNDGRVSSVLTPGEYSRTKDVLADIMRDSKAKELASDGSLHADNLNTAATDAVGSVTKAGPKINALANFLMGGANGRVAKRVVAATLDPAEYAKVLRTAMAQDQLFNALGAGIRGGANKTFDYLGKYPGVYNVLQEQRDKQQTGK